MQETSWKQRDIFFPFRFDFKMEGGKEGDVNYLMSGQYFRKKIMKDISRRAYFISGDGRMYEECL